MFAGHFGLAAAVKGKNLRLPLWTLLVSTQLLDIVFVPLSLIGLEEIGEPIVGGTGNVIYAEYSHSLVGAIVLSAIAGKLAARFWGRNSGFVIGAVTFSHWILDLIVHVPDLPILPGNLGGFQYVGFGLWQYPIASILLEGFLIAAGIILYFRYVFISSDRKWRRNGLMKGSIMALLLLLSFVFGI